MRKDRVPMQGKMIWAELVHLGANMWWDAPKDPNNIDPKFRYRYSIDHVRWDERVWREWTEKMAEIGMNMLVIDLGEALCYPSHPELAVRGSWSPDRMKSEISRLKKMGIEAIPKLNFSACHDAWLGEYHRMLSTPEYYRVCEDVIRDTCEIFSRPRLFHIGFDEEGIDHMKYHCYASARHGELWWHDLLKTVGVVESCGSRAWMWSDAAWKRPEEYVRKCPKSVLQSNWYYSDIWNLGSTEKGAEDALPALRSFEILDKAGFEQVPCGTHWSETKGWKQGLSDDRFEKLVKYCRSRISLSALKGFMMAPWWGYLDDGAYTGPGVIERNREFYLESMELVRRAKSGYGR